MSDLTKYFIIATKLVSGVLYRTHLGLVQAMQKVSKGRIHLREREVLLKGQKVRVCY